MAEKRKKVEEATKEQKSLVGDDGVAVSPLSQFPGEIRFPVPFDGKQYRRFTEKFSYDASEGWQEDIFQLHYHWHFAIALAEFHLEGVDASAPFDDQDYRVLRWVADCAREFGDRFLAYGP